MGYMGPSIYATWWPVFPAQYIHTYIHVHTYVRMHIYVYTYIFVYVYMYVYMCMCGYRLSYKKLI